MDEQLIQKMLAKHIIKKGGVSTPQFSWSKQKELEFDAIPLEDLLDDPYFLDQKGVLFPEHRADILEFFGRKQAGEDVRIFFDSEAIRSGKTHKAAVMQWIVMFKNIIKYDLREHYPQIGKGYGLAMMSTSRDNEKAKDVTFEKVLPLFLNSGFFQDYFPPDVTMKEVQEMKRKPDRLRFPNRMLLYTQSGMLGELGALGFDLIWSTIDEINFFPMVKKSVREGANPDGLFDAAEELVTSCLTRIGAQFITEGKFPPFAGVHALSARRGKKDYLEKKLMEYKKDPMVMCRNRAVWEARPAEWGGKVNFCGKKFTFDTETMRPEHLEEHLKIYVDKFGTDITGILEEVEGEKENE
jgi:hypothetical protein